MKIRINDKLVDFKFKPLEFEWYVDRNSLRWRHKSMTNREPLLIEREKTHGSFAANAEITQSFKKLQHEIAKVALNDSQQQALDMIFAKLGRILAGQPLYKDHWIDVAGYAKLGAEACE